jgi:hypothetical protein
MGHHRAHVRLALGHHLRGLGALTHQLGPGAVYSRLVAVKCRGAIDTQVLGILEAGVDAANKGATAGKISAKAGDVLPATE